MEMPSMHRRFTSRAGLWVEINGNGSLRRMQQGEVTVNLFPGTELEGGPTNLYLRRFDRASHDPVGWTPLLGPSAPAEVSFGEDGPIIHGCWCGIQFDLRLRLSAAHPAWFWHLRVVNTAAEVLQVDVLYAQDIGLAHYGAIRNNEYYVSQYVDHSPLLDTPNGVAVCVRQNLGMGGANPWAVIGSLGNAVSFATDALQLHGLATRAGAGPAALRHARLAGVRRQHEHAMVTIQEETFELAPGVGADRGFYGWFEANHPEASGPQDRRFVDLAVRLPEAQVPERDRPLPAGDVIARSLFDTEHLVQAEDLSEPELHELFPGAWRHEEREGGQLLSFFAGDIHHVVLQKKELQVLRPHGHMLRSGAALVPDEAALSTTCWMNGVFNSLLAQGHVSINRFLSATHSYLSLFRADGQRLFVEEANRFRLLDVPSAFAMTPSECEWIYKLSDGLLRIRNSAGIDRHVIELRIDVLAGSARRFLLSHHVASYGDDGLDATAVRFDQDSAGVVVRMLPDSDLGRRFPQGTFRIDALDGTRFLRVAGDEPLFADGRSRRQAYLTVLTAESTALGIAITGQLVADSGADAQAAEDSRAVAPRARSIDPLHLEPPPGSALTGEVQRLQEIAPWLVHNALIHYLAPHGLEQYSGGGWGTRDVCQGPVELLLSLGNHAPVADLLRRVFRAQNPDGDWPQWFMFFERERHIRPAESHGDIVFWPVLALGQYLLVSGDGALLDVVEPFFHPDGDAAAEKATLRTHVERALEVMRQRVIPGTHLAAYGHGDWNDSLQPANPTLAEKLCSPWTVTLHYQTLRTLAQALRQLGQAGQARSLESEAEAVREDFQRRLIAGGVLAGFAHFEKDGRVDYLLHPSDQHTGIHYRLLPMIHAILNDLLTPEQAAAHVGYIREHLLCPDGAHLFDRPPRYRGGPQRFFQRAESSSFFGREIGLMYVHAHLRYAEAMAHYGDAEAFFRALCQANPIGVSDTIPNAARRQANCYYSSSDPVFADRYEAYERYSEVRSGSVPVEGGWRVYSSGAGIAVHLIRRCLLGLRPGRTSVVLDPVLPRALDGLRAAWELEGCPVQVEYRVRARGRGPLAIALNGRDVPFEREPNPYRTGAARISLSELRPALSPNANLLTIELE